MQALVSRASNRSRAPLLTAGVILLAGLALQATPAAASSTNYGLDTQLYVQATAGNQDTKAGDTGFVQGTGPLTLSYTANASGSAGLNAWASGSATSDYGALDVSGSGAAFPSQGSGAESRVIPFFGGAPDAFFRDQIFVQSSTLAPGALVSLTFSMDYTGAASFQNESPGSYISSASISSLFTLTDLNNNASSASFNVGHDLGTFHDSRTVTVAVGDDLQITGAIYGQGEAASFDAGGPSSFSFSDPMSIHIVDFTPGLDLSTASGHSYLAPQGGVPEPAAWAMMCLGLLATGSALRRRRAFA